MHSLVGIVKIRRQTRSAGEFREVTHMHTRQGHAEKVVGETSISCSIQNVNDVVSLSVWAINKQTDTKGHCQSLLILETCDSPRKSSEPLSRFGGGCQLMKFQRISRLSSPLYRFRKQLDFLSQEQCALVPQACSSLFI